MPALCLSHHKYGFKQYGTTVCKVIKRMASYDISIIKYSNKVVAQCVTIARMASYDIAELCACEVFSCMALCTLVTQCLRSSHEWHHTVLLYSAMYCIAPYSSTEFKVWHYTILLHSGLGNHAHGIIHTYSILRFSNTVCKVTLCKALYNMAAKCVRLPYVWLHTIRQHCLAT